MFLVKRVEKDILKFTRERERERERERKRYSFCRRTAHQVDETPGFIFNLRLPDDALFRPFVNHIFNLSQLSHPSKISEQVVEMFISD